LRREAEELHAEEEEGSLPLPAPSFIALAEEE
jgi:hypothetical protein